MAAETGGRTIRVRTAIAWFILFLLVLTAAFYLGWLDSLASHRVRFITQQAMQDSTGNRWLEVPVWQFPEDLVLYQEVLIDTMPDTIIETGTHQGGLTVFLSSILDNINPNAQIITVDLDRAKYQGTVDFLKQRGRGKLLERITMLEGSSTDPAIIDGVKSRLKPSGKVLIILDSDHSTEHVLKELELYTPFLSPGDYVIVNDIHLDYLRGPFWSKSGAGEAVRRFLAAHPEFEVDHTRDKFVIGCAPGGFLRKTR